MENIQRRKIDVDYRRSYSGIGFRHYLLRTWLFHWKEQIKRHQKRPHHPEKVFGLFLI